MIRELDNRPGPDEEPLHPAKRAWNLIRAFDGHPTPPAGGPEAQEPPPPSDGFTDEWPSDDYGVASHADPDFIFRWMRMGREAVSDPDAPRKMPLGMSGKHWRFTEKDQHLLAIAPPQSHAGKTSSVMIPVILGHPGPVVAATTKPDVLGATAQLRAQYGQLWVYSPDGAELGHLPPGVRELRWSPLVGAQDWDTAISTASAMTRAIDSSDVRGGTHWTERAGEMLAPFLHWAALTKRSMRDTHNAVYNAAGIAKLVEQELEEHGAERAANMLTSVLGGRHTDETTSIASTAARALRGYQKDAALRSTEDPNFDPIDFVNGGWSGVRSDTVYITGPAADQTDVAPLVVALLGQIQKVAYRRHRLAVQAEVPSPPIVFALDELYGLAPLPDLPHMLSEGGSQGLLIAAAVQDLTLIKSRWPKEAAAFLTLFGHVLMFPGVRDGPTLKAVSELLGKYDREMKSEQRRYVSWVNDNQHTEHVTYRTERQSVLDEAEVYRGIDPDNLDALIHLRPGAWDLVEATPYWRAAPWPHLLTRYFQRALASRVPEWRYWEAKHLAPEDRPDESSELHGDPLPDLPVPRLHDWAEGVRGKRDAHPCDLRWAVQFEEAVRTRDAIRSRGADVNRVAKWELPSVAVAKHGIWITTHRDARVPGGTAPPQRQEQPSLDAEPESALAVEMQEITNLRDEVEVEKQRRRARGDHESVARYEAAMVKANEDWIRERTPEQQRERDALRARNQEAQAHGATWWDVYPVPEQKRLIEEFLGGSWANAPVWTGPPAPTEEVVAPADGAEAGSGLTVEQQEFGQLLAEIEVEKSRRRGLGQHAEVARYEAACQRALADSKTEHPTPDQLRESSEDSARREAAKANGATWWDTFHPAEMKRVIDDFFGPGGWPNAPKRTTPPPPARPAPEPAPPQPARSVGPRWAPAAPAPNEPGPAPVPPRRTGSQTSSTRVPPRQAQPLASPLQPHTAAAPSPGAPPPPGVSEKRWREIQAETDAESARKVNRRWDPPRTKR